MSKLIKLYTESAGQGFSWPFVYFHGLLKRQMGDCNLVRAGVELSDVEDGLHECTAFTDVGPVKTRLALWSYDDGYGVTRRKGIVVRVDEPGAVEYQDKHFTAKSRIV